MCCYVLRMNELDAAIIMYYVMCRSIYCCTESGTGSLYLGGCDETLFCDEMVITVCKYVYIYIQKNCTGHL